MLRTWRWSGPVVARATGSASPSSFASSAILGGSWTPRKCSRSKLAPYVLDGLHHHAHQTDLRISEHYTDTAGATDHVFGLCHLLGYRFAPRIKDLKERKLYTVEKPSTWPLTAPLIGDTVETTAILGQWTELMRLNASIETGAVVPPTSP
jgi:TnpA family transposase